MLRDCATQRAAALNTGESREVTEWHRVVLDRRLAEVARDNLKKGDLIYLEGSLKTRKWQGKGGQDRYTTEIEGREVKMRKGDDPQGCRTGGGSAPARPSGRRASRRMALAIYRKTTTRSVC